MGYCIDIKVDIKKHLQLKIKIISPNMIIINCYVINYNYNKLLY